MTLVTKYFSNNVYFKYCDDGRTTTRISNPWPCMKWDWRTILRTPLVLCVAMLSLLGTASASDNLNLCLFNRNPGSTEIDLPMDDAFHYPSQWTGDPDKTNLHDPGNGLEFLYRGYHWTAVPVGGGKPIQMDGFAVYVAAMLPNSPFEGWARVVVANFVGPDGVSHQYAYAAPGEFLPETDGYDVTIGGEDEIMAIEITDAGGMAIIEDPSSFLTQMSGSGGTASYHDFISADGFIELHTREEALTNPDYVLDDGYDPIWRYYFTRPWMLSWGTMRYGDTEYYVTGYVREDHGWQQDLPSWADYQYRWAAVQIMGCTTPSGHKIPCSEQFHSIFAWDTWHISDGTPVSNYWNEVSPPPKCETHMMKSDGDWEITPLDYWISPRTGLQFTREARLTSPSRNVDLTVTAVIDDQEIYKSAFIFPGFYHGAYQVTGTINGKHVWGTAKMEQWNMKPPAE